MVREGAVLVISKVPFGSETIIRLEAIIMWIYVHTYKHRHICIRYATIKCHFQPHILRYLPPQPPAPSGYVFPVLSQVSMRPIWSVPLCFLSKHQAQSARRKKRGQVLYMNIKYHEAPWRKSQVCGRQGWAAGGEQHTPQEAQVKGDRLRLPAPGAPLALPRAGSAWPRVEQGWPRATPTGGGSPLLSPRMASPTWATLKTCGGNLAPVSCITWLARWG